MLQENQARNLRHIPLRADKCMVKSEGYDALSLMYYVHYCDVVVMAHAPVPALQLLAHGLHWLFRPG